ncbi:MAG: long-chain fatty acid--CoA ligase [Chloroflexi bacterium]|nr:long-chain fatty acid--CoA ligase [Chloroflexota bacterium]
MNDKPWLKHYEPKLPHSLKPYPEITLLDVVKETVKDKPDYTALIFKGRKMSYAELDRLSDQFAAALSNLGVKKGERVVSLLPNSPQAIIAQLGVWKAGAITAPMNALYTERELEQMLNEIGAETVIVLTPFYAKLKSVQAKTPVKRVIASNIKDYLSPLLKFLFTVAKEKKEGHRITLQPGDYWWSDLMSQSANAPRPNISIGIDDPAILLFSGGTTGLPKAALGSHHALYMSARQLHAYAATTLDDWTDRITLVMPMFHVYGNMAFNTSLVARWPMVVIPNPRDIDDLVAEIRKERPAVLHGVPTLFIALLNHPKVKAGQVDFKSMKVCYSGAAPLLLETKKRFEALTGGWLLEAYGMTETMLAAVVCPVHAPYKEGSTGIPLPDVEVRIVDVNDDSKTLPACEIGEVIIRAPQLMSCYWNRPRETADMLREGWCYTGDIGYLDEDGYLFIVDRKKDLIKPASGFQVWPREVEEVIAAHPAVFDVSVAGVPTKEQSEVVKAWIVLRGGAQATEEDIVKHCRERLAGYKVPKLVEFRDQLPKTMVGKVLRRNLVAEDNKR